MNATRTAVVLLNWRNFDDTLECMESLISSQSDCAILVVDNDSGDGSAERLEATGLATVVLRSGGNLGFSGGNNVGLRWALARGYGLR